MSFTSSQMNVLYSSALYTPKYCAGAGEVQPIKLLAARPDEVSSILRLPQACMPAPESGGWTSHEVASGAIRAARGKGEQECLGWTFLFKVFSVYSLHEPGVGECGTEV